MGLTTNISAFGNLALQNALVDSYRMLVALELALKEANCSIPGTGHNVPGMLANAANLPALATTPLVGAQLLGYSATLRADLVAITCEHKNGGPTAVQGDNYPHIRYTRCHGDWGGVDETSAVNLSTLESTCHLITQFLRSHATTIGVQL
jgi:hypothetical protein